MRTSDLVFIGIRGSVVAQNRATGQKAWATHPKGSGFVNVLVETEAVLAACTGKAALVLSYDPWAQ